MKKDQTSDSATKVNAASLLESTQPAVRKTVELIRALKDWVIKNNLLAKILFIIIQPKSVWIMGLIIISRS